MNIAVLAKKTALHKNYGGLETQTKVLVEGLAANGHSITVFSPTWELTPQEKTENNIKYVFVDCVYRMGPIFGFFGTYQKTNWINRSVDEFSRYHSAARFDLVLAQSSTGLGVIKKKDELGVKVVSIAHGSIISEYKTFLSSMSFPKDIVSFVKNTGFTLKNFFRRQREFVHGSDKVICVSNFVKTALIEETFALDDKFVVIHNGIDSQPFSNNADAPVSRQRKLLFVGQILKSKGMDDVLSLAVDARFSDVSIDVIGSGDYFEEFSNKLKDAGVLDRVHMFGKLPYTEVINVYKNSGASVFIFPTKRIEGFPMVLVEAMFAGLPIIAYSMGGVSDAVVDGKTGYLLPANDFNSFKDRILELLENKSLCAEFSANAQSLATEQFSVKSMIMNYESVLTEVSK